VSPGRFLGALALGIGCVCATHADAGPGSVSKPALIEVRGDRLTGRIEGVPLRQVLAELHRQAGVQSEFVDLADDDAVSESFRDLPLDEAISRLLNGRSFLLYRESAVAGPRTAAPSLHLVILPRTRAPTTPPNPAPTPLGLDEAARAMVDPDENVRARAQEHFERALATQQESAAGTAPPRR
jgi:hypothetical protein